MAVSRIQASDIQEVIADHDCGKLDSSDMALSENDSQRQFDLHELLGTVVAVIRDAIPCDGIEYIYDEIEMYYADGQLEEHSASYTLSMQQVQLGEIRLTRTTAFQPEELRQVEIMLAGLVDPLRHALWFYHDMNCYANNSTRFNQRIQMEVERCLRTGRELSLIKLVPADSKQLYRAGSDAFDEDAVIALIDMIDQHSRRIDTVYRLAEDEYTVLLPLTNKEVAAFVADRLSDQISNLKIRVSGEERTIGMCFGIASYIEGDDAGALLDRTESELLRARIRHNASVSLVMEDEEGGMD